MSLTNGQKKALHSAARQAGLDEQERRLIQQNIGGFFSAADRSASREGFIAVMAFCEKRCGGCLAGCTVGYWSAQDAQANPLDGLRHRLNHQAAAMGWSPGDVDRFLASEHMSSGLYGSVEDAPAYWLGRLLEALKAIASRRIRSATRG